MRHDALDYKGYEGSVGYNKEDDVLYGKILDIGDLVNYEGKTLTDLKKAFREAVDDYLQNRLDLGLAVD